MDPQRHLQAPHPGKMPKEPGLQQLRFIFSGPFSRLFSSKFGRFPLSIIFNLQSSLFFRLPRTPCKWEHPPLPDVHWALTQLTDSVCDVTSGAMEPLRPVAVQPWDAELHSSTTQAPRASKGAPVRLRFRVLMA